ncbi:MAG: twin-arginine translocation signal domain-containing protein, partial [Thermomicrobiales bacterium]|nr:twin-arginine translocation signal domain-containing protein [Thermomicrobiales bacterium]
MTSGLTMTRPTASTSTRRDVIKGAAALGLAAALPLHRGVPASAAPARQTDPKMLTIAVYGTPVNLDPHSAYDYRSGMAIRGPF